MIIRTLPRRLWVPGTALGPPLGGFAASGALSVLPDLEHPELPSPRAVHVPATNRAQEPGQDTWWRVGRQGECTSWVPGPQRWW